MARTRRVTMQNGRTARRLPEGRAIDRAIEQLAAACGIDVDHLTRLLRLTDVVAGLRIRGTEISASIRSTAAAVLEPFILQ